MLFSIRLVYGLFGDLEDSGLLLRKVHAGVKGSIELNSIHILDV